MYIDKTTARLERDMVLTHKLAMLSLLIF